MRKWLVSHPLIGQIVKVAWTGKGAIRKVRREARHRWRGMPVKFNVAPYVARPPMARVNLDGPQIVPEGIHG